MTEIRIRPARPGDGAALARIHLEAGAYHADLAATDFQLPAEEGLAAYVEAELEPADGVLVLVAELDQEPVASLFAHLVPALEAARYQWNSRLGEQALAIDYLATGEAHRRRGIAKMLVEAAEEWARERGATVASTETYLGSPLSLPFWERGMGYRRRSVNLTKDL